MASPAPPRSSDVQHPAAAAPAACESCWQRPAVPSPRSPDPLFRVRQACVPLELTNAAEPFVGQVDRQQLDWQQLDGDQLGPRSEHQTKHRAEQPAQGRRSRLFSAVLSSSLLQRAAGAPDAVPVCSSERIRGAGLDLHSSATASHTGPAERQ